MTDPRATLEVARQRTQDALNQAIGLASQAGRKDIARQLTEQGRRFDHGPEVALVVVGETKRGKSSLINAIVGMENLLPVDADVATNVHLVVRHAPSTSARVLVGAEEQPREIPLTEISSWASVSGNPGNLKGVRSVDVGIDDPLLDEGLAIVDTPGVGGLDSAHGATTLAALAVADALMFVVDAAAPISAPELAFIERASQRVETVLVALTKKDAYGGWSLILEEDRALISEHAPRFKDAPIVPVSSRLAAKSAEMRLKGDGALAEELLEESGLRELGDLLRTRVLGRASFLRLANLARASKTAVAVLISWQSAAAAGDLDDPELQKALGAELGVLEGFKRDSAHWTTTLDDEFRFLRNDVNTALKRTVADLEVRLESEVSGAKPGLLASLPERVNAELQAVQATLEATIHERVPVIASSVIGAMTVEVDRAFEAAGEGAAVAVRVSTPASFADPQSRARSTWYSWSMGSGVVGLATQGLTAIGLAIGALPAFALMAAGGALTAALGRRSTEHARDENQARRLMKSALADGVAQISPEIEERITRIQRQLQLDVKQQVDERDADLKGTVKDLERRKQQSEQKKKDERERAGTSLEQARGLEAQLDTLLSDLNAGSQPAG